MNTVPYPLYGLFVKSNCFDKLLKGSHAGTNYGLTEYNWKWTFTRASIMSFVKLEINNRSLK